MSISTATELKSAFDNWGDRAGDTSVTGRYDEFIVLAEAYMQRELKLLEFEGTASITITAGVGTLPTDYLGMRSIYWDGDTDRLLQYITPAEFDRLRNESGSTSFYTISGTTIRTSPPEDGTAKATYNAKFTALATTNTLLTTHPDVYLYGGLRQLSIYVRDDADAAKYTALLNECVRSIQVNNAQRKFAGPLQVRAR